MSKLQNKLSNTRYNFSKNFFKALIAPVVAVILAVIFTFTFGFNKSLDYSGGVLVSVVAGVDVNLQDSKTYNEFKDRVDKVLLENNITGDVYSVEVNDKEENTLVVKFAYSGTSKQKTTLISDLKSDLKAEFYNQMTDEDINNNKYVLVSTFGSSVSKTILLYVVLSTIISVILMCAYIAIRFGLNAGMLSMLMAGFNTAMTVALFMVTRIQMLYATFAVIPFVAIVSVIAALVYIKKAKDMFTNTQKYTKETNEVLANDAVKATLSNQILLSAVSGLALLIIGLFNICNSVLYLALAFFVAVAVVLYSNTLLLPGLFAKTFARKQKKVKQQKQNVEEKKLTEEEVMKETDLDNLVSN